MFDDVLDNFITVVEAITPPTEEDRPWKFQKGTSDKAPKTAAQERRFTLEVPTRVTVGDYGPMGRDIYLSKTVSVAVAYPLSKKDILATEKQIQRDLDTLIYQVIKPVNNGNAGYTGVEVDRIVHNDDYEVDVDEDFTFAIVRIPFQVDYRLTFAA